MSPAAGWKACCNGFPNNARDVHVQPAWRRNSTDTSRMSTKTKTLDVTIMGRSYKVACADDEREGLLAAVAHLDGKMGEIKTGGKVASAERIAVMAALNIAHELLQLRADTPAGDGFDFEGLKRRMNSMQAMLDEVLVPQERLL
jgi:cell division protein ZapA